MSSKNNTKVEDNKKTTNTANEKPNNTNANTNNTNSNTNNNPPADKPQENKPTEKPSSETTNIKPQDSTAPANNNSTTPKPKKKLNPIKPKGKAPAEEKNSLNNQRKNTNNKNTKRNSVKNKKEELPPEKELYTNFGKRILNYKGEEMDLDINTFLKYAVIGILFTGSWVPPAKEFLTQLETLYKEVNKDEKVFEIIQISSEKTEKSYNENRNENRPWLYLPFNDSYMKTLVEQFKVEYLPCFIIVNRDMFILSENGRKDMTENEGVKAYEKWYKSYRTRKEALEKEKEDKDDELNAHEEEEIGD
jgi:hypothetical protein